VLLTCNTAGGADPAHKFRGGGCSNIWQSVPVGSQVSFRIVQNHDENSYFRSVAVDCTALNY